MSFPTAIVLTAFITGTTALLMELLRQRSKNTGSSDFRTKLELQEKALKNLADQTVKEISNLRDRVGTMALSMGLKSKEPK